MAVSSQNPDGSWSPAQAVPWADGIDWEVSGRGSQRHAIAYWHADRLAVVEPGRFFALRLAVTHRRLKRRLRRAGRQV